MNLYICKETYTYSYNNNVYMLLTACRIAGAGYYNKSNPLALLELLNLKLNNHVMNIFCIYYTRKHDFVNVLWIQYVSSMCM